MVSTACSSGSFWISPVRFIAVFCRSFYSKSRDHPGTQYRVGIVEIAPELEHLINFGHVG